MVENLTDDEILQRLKRYDEKVTGEFLYDTCRIAYCIDDRKYGLRYKTGLDFYSLAHEYYLRLLNNDWRQIEKRQSNTSLANWMMNGFHFLVRERLKTYSKGHIEESIEERASKGQLVFDAPENNSMEEVKDMIEEICHAYYGADRKAQSILRMILIMGMKGKEVASMLGISPAAVSQRYHTMMEDVVRPYFVKYYTQSPVSYKYEYADVPSSTSMDSVYMEKASERDESEKPRLWSRFKFHLYHSKDLEAKPPKVEKPRVINPRLVTPLPVQTLQKNEVFVFGSDLRGVHCGGTAYQALRSFGAQLGKGVGPQGQCYAIPTIVGGLGNIKPYIDDFHQYVSGHPQQVFLVTPIGCGLAGFTPKDIAPMFEWAKEMDNISLPQEFWDVINYL